MKKRVALVGATGIAGQQFIPCLAGHPWFEITALAASERSAGKTYREAITDPASGARRWWCQEEPPAALLDMAVQNAEHLDPGRVDVIFSAIESDAARRLEGEYAKTTPVISTASAYRYEPDVPLILPGVNFDHADLIVTQRKNRGWKGFVVPIPNCTVTGLAIPLKPLHDAFGLDTVVMTSMQAVSGAGRSPGVVALDNIDNVIPYIPKEEEKVEREAKKILGTLRDGGIADASIRVTATCTRVPVLEGHTEAVFATLKRPFEIDAARRAMSDFAADAAQLGLPTMPRRLIVVHSDPFRPQPRLDRDTDGGMVTTVGRLRVDQAVPQSLKYVLVSHNTRMGAARGAVLVAEYLHHAKML